MDVDLSDLLTQACSPMVERVEASFVRKKDFYYGWSISGRVATLRICDYMQGAPKEVLGDFGRMIVRRGLNRSWAYPESFIDYVSSNKYILSGRPVFVKRSRNLTRTDAGEHATLSDSVQRLLDSELLEPSDIENSYMSWTRNESYRKLGFCSTMFRVVGISAILDSKDVPDELRDYVVYHECLHLRQRYNPSGRSHNSVFKSWEHRFPEWKKCEGMLIKLR